MPELDGATVVLTRAPDDNAGLRGELEGRGAVVVELPAVAIALLDDDRTLVRALHLLTASDRLVLTSRHGAIAVGRALRGRPLRAPLAVIGAATREAAERAGLRPDFSPSRPDGATLGRELPLPAGTVLLARSDRALPELVEVLRARGAAVREVVAYRTASATGPAADRPARLRDGSFVVVVASPSAVDGLAALAGNELAAGARVVALGARTADRVRARLGREPHIAAAPNDAAVLDAITTSLKEASHER